MEALFRDAGVTGWLIAGADDPFLGDRVERAGGVHAGSTDGVLEAAAADPEPGVPGLVIEQVDPDDPRAIERWTNLYVTGFGLEDVEAGAWRRIDPILVRARGWHHFIAVLDGRDVAASAMFVRRRVAAIGPTVVLADARGRGVQRALIVDRARRADALGARHIQATAALDGPSARNLERLGIRRIWTRGYVRVDPA